jgi:hypothetical protein
MSLATQETEEVEVQTTQDNEAEPNQSQIEIVEAEEDKGWKFDNLTNR